ncbi:biotin/lipoyl-containing protein, partial [Paraglaciecola sp.]
ATTSSTEPSVAGGEPLNSPLAGNIFKVLVRDGDVVNAGDVVVVMEAMKMETEVRAATSGTVSNITIKEGDAVQAGQPLFVIG